MAAETSSFKIERLNGKNFQTWKFNMKCLLMERGLWGFVTGTVVKPIKLEVVEGETTATDVFPLSFQDTTISYGTILVPCAYQFH